MGRAELLELRELKELLEEHQPILEDRENALKGEVNRIFPELEHSIIGCIYAYNRAEKSLIDAVKVSGMNIVEKCVPLPSIGIRLGEADVILVEEKPDYSTTLSEVEVDFMVDEFRELLHQIINIAKNQAKMQALKDELGEIRRKNNAIKHALLPDIKNEMSEIQEKIEQEETDTLIQLKAFKKMQK